MTQWGLDNLFNPGKRHMDDEKRRLQSTREEIGDASGGRRIDLEGGKVSISVRRPTDVSAADRDDPDDVTGDLATDDDTALAPALEVEDVPALALANDEAEIVPAVVDETDHETDHEVGRDDVEPDEGSHDDVDEPAAAPEPAPVAAAPRRRQVSASAWSRRG